MTVSASRGSALECSPSGTGGRGWGWFGCRRCCWRRWRGRRWRGCRWRGFRGVSCRGRGCGGVGCRGRRGGGHGRGQNHRVPLTPLVLYVSFHLTGCLVLGEPVERLPRVGDL